jgi:hypothetical protein
MSLLTAATQLRVAPQCYWTEKLADVVLARRNFCICRSLYAVSVDYFYQGLHDHLDRSRHSG